MGRVERRPGTRSEAAGGLGLPGFFLFGGALGVEGEEASQNFVADFVGPAVAPGLLAAAGAVLVVLAFLLVVQDELAVRGYVIPAVGGEDGAVHGFVEFAQSEDRRVVLLRVVEAVVGLRQAFLVGDHDLGAVFVVLAPAVFQVCVGGPHRRKRKGSEASGWRIQKIVFPC